MFVTGMLGMVVVSGDWKKGVSAIVNVMHEIESEV